MSVVEAETEYRWLDAAKIYEENLKSKSLDSSCAAELWQQIGFCYSMASRQAEDFSN